MAARSAPSRVQGSHRRRPARSKFTLMRTLNTILPTPLSFQLVHLADLLANITAALAHLFSTLFQSQDISSVGSLAERWLAGRCWHADLSRNRIWLSRYDWLSVKTRGGDQGCVSVVHSGCGRLPDWQGEVHGSGM
jgi:hypothetical protein